MKEMSSTVSETYLIDLINSKETSSRGNNKEDLTENAIHPNSFQRFLITKSGSVVKKTCLDWKKENRRLAPWWKTDSMKYKENPVGGGLAAQISKFVKNFFKNLEKVEKIFSNKFYDADKIRRLVTEQYYNHRVI